MKKTIQVILFLTCACSQLQAQVNFVLNPSFEQYTRCPYDWNQIRFATSWSPIDTNLYYWSQVDTFDITPICAPEYCNTCDTANYFASTPLNEYFYQWPRTGNGMAQAIMYYDESSNDPYKRDYIQGRLYNHLTAGKSYCVTFYVNLEEISTYSINHIGAYLDNGSIDNLQDSMGCASPQTAFMPQVYTTTVINDTEHWTRIEGSFVANGSERFITIGNFFDKAHTTAVYTAWANAGWTCYLVDDVSVIESDLPAFAGRDTLIQVGDSVFLGRQDLMPDMKWHVPGNNTVIDSSAGFWAKPAQTTTYVLQQTLCGMVKYDTVKVAVAPVAVGSMQAGNSIIVYPNPAQNVVNVAYGTMDNATIQITDIAGRTLINQQLPDHQNKCAVDIHTLSGGLYLYKVLSGGVMVKEGKMVKE